jgi:hypothetical protein
MANSNLPAGEAGNWTDGSEIGFDTASGPEASGEETRKEKEKPDSVGS